MVMLLSPVTGALRRVFEKRQDDPHERLTKLRNDTMATRAAIRRALTKLAERNGISRQDIDEAMYEYADDLLAVAITKLEDDIEREMFDRYSIERG
jgi:hypothetical protein